MGTDREMDADTDVFTSTTHKMLGWDLTQNADVASYVAGGAIDDALKAEMLASDGTVTLYAVWAERTREVIA